MKRRAVFVDASFLAAVADANHPHHHWSRGYFEQLVDRYEAGRTTLRTHAGMVRSVPAGVTRVLDVTPLRRWLRREARRVRERHPELDLDRAAALVLMHRERIPEVATLEPWWHRTPFRQCGPAGGHPTSSSLPVATS